MEYKCRMVFVVACCLVSLALLDFGASGCIRGGRGGNHRMVIYTPTLERALLGRFWSAVERRDPDAVAGCFTASRREEMKRRFADFFLYADSIETSHTVVGVDRCGADQIYTVAWRLEADDVWRVKRIRRRGRSRFVFRNSGGAVELVRIEGAFPVPLKKNSPVWLQTEEKLYGTP